MHQCGLVPFPAPFRAAPPTDPTLHPVLSFLLFLWEARKARAIIRSRDISYAFTNVRRQMCFVVGGHPSEADGSHSAKQVMAQNYYSLKSYDTFCFFSQIDNSKKKKDEYVFSAVCPRSRAGS